MNKKYSVNKTFAVLGLMIILALLITSCKPAATPAPVSATEAPPAANTTPLTISFVGPLTGPDGVDGQPGRDGEQPRRERSIRVVTLERPEHPDEGLLGQVLGIFAPPDHPEDHRVDLALVHLDQLPVGLLVAGQTPPNETRFDAHGLGSLCPLTGGGRRGFHGGAP